MPAAYKPVPIAPFLKGCNAATDPFSQPKGSFPRGSNLVLNKRGALDTCDGSQLIHAFNGAVQAARGKAMCDFLFKPTGVSSYYLRLMKALDIPLGAPQNLVLATTGGGALPAATYFYKVTAIDGASGETLGSAEASIVTGANGKNTLTWNVVPNATGYNVYRSTASGLEVLLTGSPTAVIPIPQVATGTLTVSFVDDGTTSIPTYLIVSANCYGAGAGVSLATFVLTTTAGLTTGSPFIVTGTSNSKFNGTWQVFGVASGTQVNARKFNFNLPSFGSTTTGGTAVSAVAPPAFDTTQQTALYKMPVISGTPAILPVGYNNSNVVALFPADPIFVDGGGGGGSGGGGGTGGGGSGGGSGSGSTPTPAGGVPGNVSTIPQMVQFTNRVAMAMGNGFPPQLFSDPGTLVNPATVAAIAAISVDPFGVVTVTTSVPHGLVAAQVGANVVIAGVLNALYNFVGPTIAILSTTQYQVRNLAAIGQAASSGGKSTTTAVPIISTFVPAFPQWSATTSYSTNSIVQPSPANGHFYKAIQGGTSGAAQPAFPTVSGQQINDGSIIWQEAGATNTAAPPPQGAAHVYVYAGSLFWWNTASTNTANGLDGPCSLRMSDVNNPNSYNPLNQAFLDKDDGTEGMGLQSFTITAQGIPPEGSLIIFKNYGTYQMVGIFGSPNLTIQKVKTTMGNLAPRSIQFVPGAGFGIVRFTHLGFGMFDGVQDFVISEEMRPFLFPSNASEDSDITILDSNFQSSMWGFQTAQPPMFCAAIPIGSSGGQLTRILCYDLVLKAWTAPIDLPFPISTASQFVTNIANPVTTFGGFSDGCLSRWQAGDPVWDVGATGARNPSNVNWSVKFPEAFSQSTDQKLNCRRVAIRGFSSGNGAGFITVTPVVNGKSKPAKPYTIPTSGDFEVFSSFMLDGQRFSAIIAGSGQVELSRPSYHVSDKAIGAARVIA